MRDAILTGIENYLESLTPYPIEVNTAHLADAILHSLSQIGTGTVEVTAPVVTNLRIDLNDVIANAADRARGNMAEVFTNIADEDSEDGEPTAITLYERGELVTYAVTIHESQRAVREALFRIQPMFGVKTRIRVSPQADDLREFLIVGDQYTVRDVETTIRNLLAAIPEAALDNLTHAEQRTLWAAVGDVLTSTADAQQRIANMADMYAYASAAMNHAHGPARNLPRAAAATEGLAYQYAVDVARTAS